jgi:hypothetical protein
MSAVDRSATCNSEAPIEGVAYWSDPDPGDRDLRGARVIMLSERQGGELSAGAIASLTRAANFDTCESCTAGKYPA